MSVLCTLRNSTLDASTVIRLRVILSTSCDTPRNSDTDLSRAKNDRTFEHIVVFFPGACVDNPRALHESISRLTPNVYIRHSVHSLSIRPPWVKECRRSYHSLEIYCHSSTTICLCLCLCVAGWPYRHIPPPCSLFKVEN